MYRNSPAVRVLAVLGIMGLKGVRGADTATVSMTAAPAFIVEQACAQDCLWGDSLGVFGLPAGLGCTSIIYNACMCTSAVEAKASSFLSLCISEACEGSDEITAAISVYDGYCTGAGYPRANEAVPTQTAAPTETTIPGSLYTVTLPSQTNTYTQGVVPVVTVASTAPASAPTTFSNENQSSNQKKAPIGAIVGGVVGGVIFIALLVVIFFLFRRMSNMKRKNAGQPNIQQQQNMPQNMNMPGPGGPPTPAPQYYPQNMASPVSPMSTHAVPVVAPFPKKVPVGGRAELDQEKPPAPAPVVIEQPTGITEEEQRTMAASHAQPTEVEGRGYGLRREEMDAQGRYIGELHGDGRYGTNVELPGSNGWGNA